jgi:hypothetical protein
MRPSCVGAAIGTLWMKQPAEAPTSIQLEPG